MFDAVGEARLRALEGAQFLDELPADILAPGWRARIRQGDLDIEDPCHCMMGQLFGDYNEFIEEQDIPRGALIRMGVFEPGRPSSDLTRRYDLLTNAWKDVINEGLETVEYA